MYREYDNYGTFKVTTEGDIDGRSVKELGVYTGYIDEIAFALADKCTYSLSFKAVDYKELDMTPKRDTVQIALDIDSGLWNLSVDEAEQYFRTFFAGRDVDVVSAKGYGSCLITTNKKTIAQRKEEILSKLTKEERQILGL